MPFRETNLEAVVIANGKRIPLRAEHCIGGPRQEFEGWGNPTQVPRFRAPWSFLPRAIDGVLGASPHSIPKRALLDALGDGCASERRSRNENSQSKRLVACSDKLRVDRLGIY